MDKPPAQGNPAGQPENLAVQGDEKRRHLAPQVPSVSEPPTPTEAPEEPSSGGARRSPWSPKPKVATSVAVGTPLAIVLSWLAGLAGLEMPVEVSLALAGLIVGAVGYFTPE